MLVLMGVGNISRGQLASTLLPSSKQKLMFMRSDILLSDYILIKKYTI